MTDFEKERDEKLDHPCRQTCSGWQQGFERGKSESEKRIQELEEKVKYWGNNYHVAYDRAVMRQEKIQSLEAWCERFEKTLGETLENIKGLTIEGDIEGIKLLTEYREWLEEQ